MEESEELKAADKVEPEPLPEPADEAEPAREATLGRVFRHGDAGELAPMRTAPAPQAAPPPPPPPAAQATRGRAVKEMQAEATTDSARRVGERSFALRDGVWFQAEYEGEAVEEVERDSYALDALVRLHPDLAPVLDLGDRVVFLAGDKWYRVAPSAKE
jgi:hypothetical protein